MTKDEIAKLKKRRSIFAIREVVKITGCSDSTIRRYCKAGVCAPEVDDLQRRLFTWKEIHQIIKYRDASPQKRKELKN